jgi:hypothetical protein
MEQSNNKQPQKFYQGGASANQNDVKHHFNNPS